MTLYEAATGRQLRQFKSGQYNLTYLAFSPDGATLVSGSQAGSICLWEVATGKKLRVVGNDDQWHAAVKAVAYSPDGQTLAAGGWEQTIHRWDVATGKLRRPFVAHEGPIFNVAFSADNRKLLTAGYDGEGHAWSLASGREVVSVWTGKPCRCRSFLASGRMMVTVQEGVQIRDFVAIVAMS